MAYQSPPPFQIHRPSRFSALGSFATTIFAIVGSIACAILLNLFVFQSYYVDGESMSPTLHSDNRLVVSKVERTIAHIKTDTYVPERGQIVVINGSVSPSTFDSAPELIKRVVAVPGDTVQIINGVVVVSNNKEGTFNLDRSLGLSLDPTYSPEDISVYVPEGKVFVLGDNRAKGGSHDSRAFGLVDTSLIDGRLWALIMPFDDRRVF